MLKSINPSTNDEENKIILTDETRRNLIEEIHIKEEEKHSSFS